MRSVLLAAAMLLAVHLPAHAQKSADTLRVTWRDAVPDVDPYYNTQRNGAVIADLAWDRLIDRDPETQKLVPALATAWRQVDDTTLEFTLRPGVTFQNGDPFGADDVVYTVNTVLTDRSVATPSNYSWLAGAEKIDDLHVRLRLKRLFPPALNYIAAVLPIWPHAYRERVGADAYAKAPIGTGPYRILPIEGIGQIAMERFEGYYAGSPKGRAAIRRIVIHQVSDPSTEMTELLGGRADWIYDFNNDQFDAIARMPQLRAVRAEIQRTTYLNMDAAGRAGPGPLQDVRVRQAIAYAIDRETMARQLMQGGSRVLDVACFPSEFGCETASATHYTYDPAKSRRLLAEAGFPDGFETDLYTYLPAIWAGAIQNYLKAVGIDLHIHQLAAAAVVRLAQEGKTPVTFAGWGGFAVNDVSSVLGYFYTGGLYDLSRDAGLARLVDQGAATNAADSRRQVYAQAFKRITEQAYFLPIFTYVKTYAFSRDLNFKPYLDDNPRFYRAAWR